ncbi:endospore germination permease [Halalkalibacter sp. AB-rgal2]|uniref:GerAB/ArcD/ProY family transporter n=1 Tax=Halalkalibacter sp. AB-rgal2 TaxID=3242695 RepID=UPI00359DFD0A
MQHREITVFHVILFLLMSTGLKNHVILIPSLLEVARRDAWISIIITALIYPIYMLMIYVVIRNTNQQNLYGWFKERVGGILSKVIVMLIVIYLLTTSLITLKDLTLWTKITYLPQTPDKIIAFSFLLLCMSMAITSIRTIAIVNGVLLPIVIFLGFFVMSANFPNKDYSLLFPIFENGLLPTIKGMVYVGAGMIELFIILFIQHRVKTKITFMSLVVIGALLVWITLGPTMGTIANFGPEKAGQLRFPAFEQWALVSLGRFVEHIDFLSIFQWLSGAFVRISLLLFLIIDLLQIENRKRRIKVILICGSIIALALSIPLGDIQYEELMTVFILPGLLLFASLLFVVIFVLSILRKGSSVQYEKEG